MSTEIPQISNKLKIQTTYTDDSNEGDTIRNTAIDHLL